MVLLEMAAVSVILDCDNFDGSVRSKFRGDGTGRMPGRICLSLFRVAWAVNFSRPTAITQLRVELSVCSLHFSNSFYL